MHPTMNRFLASFLLVLATVLGHAQGTMNIYQTNGSILQVALSSIDSVTYQLAPPPPLMRIHQTGGSILSLAVAQIDSITYSTGGAPGTAQVATLPATAVGSTTAVCAGTITSDGGSSVTARGICYGTVPLPDLSGPFISVGAGIGTFQGQITGLQPNTLYYARAYATNGQGTAYGNAVAFVTTGNTGGTLPTVVSTQPTGVNSHSASAGGQVTDDGGNSVVARGVVWGTAPNPTLANSFTVDGGGLGSFTSSLIDLPAATSFFVRAYATNGAGTAYGGAFQITTGAATLSGVTTDAITAVGITTATASGTVQHQGGVPVTDRGFCWSTSPDPTVQSNQGLVSAGSGLGGFVVGLTGLVGNTTYYVRAYATNAIGTAYGNGVMITTQPPALLTTTVISGSTSISALSGGTITNDFGSPITSRGVCWSLAPNPTISDNITSDGSGSGIYISELSGLTPLTTYYVRAYTSSAFGVAYGNETVFTTASDEIITNGTEFVTANSANVSCTFAMPIPQFGTVVWGVCWSTIPQPQTNDNNVFMSPMPGFINQTLVLSSLQENTTFYARAFISIAFLGNTQVYYGNEIQFTTTAMTTAPVTAITGNSAISGGTVPVSVAGPITARGVCWSTNPAPTIADNVTNDGNGEGSYTSEINGLQEGLTYYIRAYRTNSLGTEYGNELQFTTAVCCLFSPGPGVIDNEGNSYATIILNNGQEWMSENLRTTTYANGDPIPNVSDNGQWAGLSAGAWAHYENNSNNDYPYGKLYNRYAVSDPRNVCPMGWHVPSDTEWFLLSNYLGVEAGGKMKSSGTQFWLAPNTGATNLSGFSGLPAGIRNYDGAFYEIGSSGYWWTNSLEGNGFYWNRSLNSTNPDISRNYRPPRVGHSVRCVRD
jgi:uncharacterized protein (TIGR02145 family)